MVETALMSADAVWFKKLGFIRKTIHSSYISMNRIWATDELRKKRNVQQTIAIMFVYLNIFAMQISLINT